MIKKPAQIGLLIIYTFFCFLMLKITLQYVPINTDVAFLRIKQDFIHLQYYKIAFFVHVFSAIISLLAGYTQFSKKIRTNYPKIHRRLGWIYILSVLLFAAPSGFIIGIFANGGISSQIAFCLLSTLWILFTVKALLTAKKKQFSEHRKWMIRSFALTLSAITLRAWKVSLVYFFHPKPMDIYQVVAWLGWVLNLIIAEIIIFKSKSTR
jgi:uncharacterized membrane protein